MYARSRAHDRAIYETMRVAVLVAVRVVDVRVFRSHQAEAEMPVRACMFVAMNVATVAMRCGSGHEREA
jgi:hypothetical protein